jgi:hypothetical protein
MEDDEYYSIPNDHKIIKLQSKQKRNSSEIHLECFDSISKIQNFADNLCKGESKEDKKEKSLQDSIKAKVLDLDKIQKETEQKVSSKMRKILHIHRSKKLVANNQVDIFCY